MNDEHAKPAGLPLNDGLGPLPTSAEDEAVVRSRLSKTPAEAYERGYMDGAARERERWKARVEEAFRDGYCSRETYNDKETSCVDDQWASAKAYLLRA